jgi:hypothetical protein
MSSHFTSRPKTSSNANVIQYIPGHNPSTPPPHSWYSQPAFYYSIIVLGIIIGISLLSKWSESDKQYSKPFLRKIKTFIEQATRWNAMATQDTNSILQLVHCNYALAYAQVVKNVASYKDIENITGIDINELIYYLEECQSASIKNIGQQCPKIKIDGVYSVGSGWT